MAVRDGCNGHDPVRNAYFAILATVRSGDDIRQHRHVDGELANSASNRVSQVGRDALTNRRRILTILDTQQQAIARRIGKSNAALGDFAPVRCPSRLTPYFPPMDSFLFANALRCSIGSTRSHPVLISSP